MRKLLPLKWRDREGVLRWVKGWKFGWSSWSEAALCYLEAMGGCGDCRIRRTLSKSVRCPKHWAALTPRDDER